MKLANVFKACVIGASLLAFPPGYAAASADNAAEASTRQAPRSVNINTADAATLADALQGVGLKKAEAIVAYRNEHGPFKSVDDMVNVKGIGEKSLEKLRPQVAL